MAFVDVNGLDVHYVDRGSGSTIVFLHGFGSCAEAWYQQFAVLANRYRCVAYDSVNHGHSANSPAGRPEPDRADELEGFLAALDIGAPILAGNSMGALTLLRWATRHPDEARALVPSGMGVTPGAEGMPEATRRSMFDPVAEESIRSPMQIIVGELDWLAGAARRLHELVPGSQLEVIAGAPHNVYYETAEPYTRTVERFLGEVTGT